MALTADERNRLSPIACSLTRPRQIAEFIPVPLVVQMLSSCWARPTTRAVVVATKKKKTRGHCCRRSIDNAGSSCTFVIPHGRRLRAFRALTSTAYSASVNSSVCLRTDSKLRCELATQVVVAFWPPNKKVTPPRPKCIRPHERAKTATAFLALGPRVIPTDVRWSKTGGSANL